MTIDANTRAICEAFVGRTREVTDSLAPEAAQKLAVVLDQPPTQTHLPPTWHWAYFNAAVPQDRLGPDGHERTGHFLPPAPYHRRMWAAGDVTVHRPLCVGVAATRVSEVTDVSFKDGRSGSMCFVTVTHRIAQEGTRAIDEVQTIVYRDRGAAETALRGPDDPVPEGYFTHPDSQLVAYSAITHNGHRIHWDRDFCRDVEGYPDLVVHGPMMATELCDAMRGDAGACRFTYRATAPVFVTTPVRIDPGVASCTSEGQMQRADGVISMRASLTIL